ncbi:MAG: ABC transporter permease [Candidatus Cyclobacteriaceae bacterium M3_2C_046]
MLSNYLKTIFASLKRRKSFALLSILSIAFSVVSITCVATYWGLLHASLPPENDKINVRFIIPEVIPRLAGGKLVQNSKSTKVAFLNSYIDKIPDLGFDEVVPFQHRDSEEIYYRQRMFQAELLWTTPNFFEVYNFEFFRGRPYQAIEIDGPLIPVVISQNLAEKVFGTVECLNEILNFSDIHDNAPLRVVGVIKPVGPWSLFFKKDIFLNLNTENVDYPYNLIVRKNDQPWSILDQELQKLAMGFNQQQEDRLTLTTSQYVEAYAELKNLDFLTQKSLFIPLLIMIIFLPAACIIHLLQSLFNERLGEMGIRKALGANTNHIIYQVISESIFIILVSGLLSILVSIPFWNLLLDVPMSVVIKDILNWQVFAFTMLAFVVTGLVIGWISSLKLARGSIVVYLNEKGA